ncbi:MAG: protein kinase, partial [bacterium]
MIGQSLGSYSIISHLGSGGMADVYLAEDTHNGARVALKILPRVYRGKPKIITRFEREIASLRKLDHPNIVKILDEGQSNGLPYYVMEYVDGPTLSDEIQHKGALPPDRVIEIASTICAALEYAHSMGIVHRDIKSANIMLTSDGIVKVADFGIAQAMDRTRLTSTGAKGIGTPQYMSPEQIRGERADGRSDLYSLGILMFELLTGRVPFRGKTPIDIAVKQMEDLPPEPATIDPGIPQWLSDVVLRLLQKDRNGRYRSARVLLKALGSQIETLDGPKEAVVTADASRSDLWVVVPWAGIIILLAVFLGGSLLSDFNSRRARIRPEILSSIPGAPPEWMQDPTNEISVIPGAHPEWMQDPTNEISVKQITRVERIKQPISSCSWSPDGTKLAVVMGDMVQLNNANIYILNMEDLSPPCKITTAADKVTAMGALHWLPDGKSIIFAQEVKSPEYSTIPCKISIEKPHDVKVLSTENWSMYIPTTNASENYYARTSVNGVSLFPIDSGGNITGGPTPISNTPFANTSLGRKLDKMLAVRGKTPRDNDLYILRNLDSIIERESGPIN